MRAVYVHSFHSHLRWKINAYVLRQGVLPLNPDTNLGNANLDNDAALEEIINSGGQKPIK